MPGVQGLVCLLSSPSNNSAEHLVLHSPESQDSRHGDRAVPGEQGASTCEAHTGGKERGAGDYDKDGAEEGPEASLSVVNSELVGISKVIGAILDLLCLLLSNSDFESC